MVVEVDPAPGSEVAAAGSTEQLMSTPRIPKTGSNLHRAMNDRRIENPMSIKSCVHRRQLNAASTKRTALYQTVTVG